MNTLHALIRVAEETEFDANTVTPGVEGFLFTGIMAAAIILLGFLLVNRLRRNDYRSEVREQIAEELAADESGAGESAPVGSDAETAGNRQDRPSGDASSASSSGS